MLILLIVVIVLLFAGLPVWPYSRAYGLWPTGGLGLVLVILLVLMFFGGGGASVNSQGCSFRMPH